MNRLQQRSWFALAMVLHLLVLMAMIAGPAAAQETKPNFVIFLVDDLGWADLGCNGSTFYSTPNIDRLAASGVNFRNGYSACPVCSPTRASILTGRHPVRVDITDWIPGDDARQVKDARFQHVEDRSSLALEETTFPEVLQRNGYQTFFAGKWHLGGEGSLPTDHGFDTNIGGCDKGSPPGGYYGPWNNPYLKANFEGEYLDERLTDECVRFLETRNAAKPFLLYLSFYNVHTPITPYKKRHEEYVAKARATFTTKAEPIPEHTGKSRSRQDNPDYGSMVAAVDDFVGRILDQLDSLGLDENTVVIFTSDNGGLCTTLQQGPTSNLPLRSGKGWLYEGGIRVPFLVRAPIAAAAGKTCDVPVTSIDIGPTVLELAGLSFSKEIALDGLSFTAALQNPAMSYADGSTPSDKSTDEPAALQAGVNAVSLTNRKLYWHYPHYHSSQWRPGAAIRDGRWKLIEFYETDSFELYDLANDIGESSDVKQQHPAVAEELRASLAAWQNRLGAKKPVER